MFASDWLTASTSFLTASWHVSLVTFFIPSLASSSRDLYAFLEIQGMFRDVKKTFIPVAPIPALTDPFDKREKKDRFKIKDF